MYFILKKGVLDGLVTTNYSFEEYTLALESPSGSFFVVVDLPAACLLSFYCAVIRMSKVVAARQWSY